MHILPVRPSTKRGYLEDLRFNGDPPHLTLNHGLPVIRPSRPEEVCIVHWQMPLAHFSSPYVHRYSSAWTTNIDICDEFVHMKLVSTYCIKADSIG